jgi:hypothetical protein
MELKRYPITPQQRSKELVPKLTKKSSGAFRRFPSHLYTANTLLILPFFQLFVERSIWTRMSLFNQFTPLESREIHK